MDHSPTLYPLYSDMENSDIDNKLMVPSPIQKQRNLRSPTSRMSRNNNYYKNMQQRRLTNKRNSRANNIGFSRKHLPKSSSLDTISSLSSFSSLTVNREDSDNEFIYNLTKGLNAINVNDNNSYRVHCNCSNNHRLKRRKNNKKRGKRRIRTFYSKKWGNKLYGLSTTNYANINNISHTENIRNSRRALSAFIEEENLDLNDIKSPRSISATPIIDDYDDDDNHFNYDSNIAAPTDDDDDDNKTQERNFKIIVSAPNNLNNLNASNNNNNMYIDNVISDDCLSSDDDDDRINKSSLFLAGNNMNVGVYSSFPYSDGSDTDYLSAQSDDFDELTICYHNSRNIRFRNSDNDSNYLSDIGPSDIGSSDTDCFSSNDSIPDSIPQIDELHHFDQSILQIQ